MKNACRRRSFCYLPVVFDRNLAYGNDFFLCGEKMFDLFLRILPRLLINFFGISRNFFIFLCFARVTGKRYKERSSWRTKYSSIILRAERMEKAREVNKGDRGAALDF